MIKPTLWAGAVLFSCASIAAADSWTLDGDASHIAFGTVKNYYIGEVSTLSGLSGTVDETGATSIDIGLGTVETNIELRNERIVEHVFNTMPTATLQAQLDMAELSKLDVGGSTVTEIDFDLTLLDEEVPLFGELFLMRVSEDKVLVTTNNMVYVATDEIGIDAGVDKLQEIMGLDDITRAVPVTLRFMFNRDGSQES